MDLVPRNFNSWGHLFEVRLPGGLIRSPGGLIIDKKMTDIVWDNEYESGSLVKFRKISRIWRDCDHEEKCPQNMTFLGTKSNKLTIFISP